MSHPGALLTKPPAGVACHADQVIRVLALTVATVGACGSPSSQPPAPVTVPPVVAAAGDGGPADAAEPPPDAAALVACGGAAAATLAPWPERGADCRRPDGT